MAEEENQPDDRARGAAVRRTLRFGALLIALFCVLMIVFPVTADDGDEVSDDEVNEIAIQLYCPICENVPLDVCPSQACADWRELIRQMLSEGKSEDEIITYFTEQYGWSVLPMPPKVGLNWLIYVLPPLISIGGIIVAVVVIRNNRKTAVPQRGEEAPVQTDHMKDYLEIINRDLSGKDDDA